MHALQHGIRNKRHIVNTKGTTSPLRLMCTVQHPRAVPVVQRPDVVMRTVEVRGTEADETATKDKTPC